MSSFEILNPAKKSTRFAGVCALGIMTKAPEAGKVKTRLTPPLAPAEAAALNTCFLRDLSDSIDAAATKTCARGVAIYTPAGSEDSYGGILPSSFLFVPQRGEGFGERLGLAVEDLLGVGFDSVCLINSDSPTVSSDIFAEAARELAKPANEIVIGPSDDGGYYLIGLKQQNQRLFEEIDWSTERVFEQTINRAREIGLKVHQLPRGFDVDDQVTLRRLCDELLGADTNIDVAKNTREFLKAIVEREGRNRIWPL